jgi:putative chitinase
MTDDAHLEDSLIDAAIMRAVASNVTDDTIDAFLQPLRDSAHEFEINAPKRVAAFLAQIGHESGGFHYVREIASGAAYEGRADLGNTEPGDGERFRGRGLIQITGRANYRECSRVLFNNDMLLKQPELLEQPNLAAWSAAWFWYSRGCNELADAGKFGDITRKINGGLNGYPDRVARYNRIVEEMGIA